MRKVKGRIIINNGTSDQDNLDLNGDGAPNLALFAHLK